MPCSTVSFLAVVQGHVPHCNLANCNFTCWFVWVWNCVSHVQGRSWAVRIEIRLPWKFVERRERHLQEGRKDCVMRIFMLGIPRRIFLERSNQEREHLKYEGKSLNKRNFILKCKEKYAQRKILFRDTKWLLSNMPYRGRDDRAVWACAIARTTWPLHCQIAPWKSNEALFVFCGQSVYETWVERFQNGRQNVSDEHRSGRPVSVATDSETADRAAKPWLQASHYWLNCRRIEHESRLRVQYCPMMTSGIGLCSRWVPRQLSDDYNRARQTIFQEHLDRHAREGDALLHRIVTGDESWVYHYEPESKRQLMRWKHPFSPANKKFKTQASTGKVMLTFFWDVNGTYRKRVKLWLVFINLIFMDPCIVVWFSRNNQQDATSY